MRSDSDPGYGRRVQFRVLGPLEVDAGDGPLPLGGPKQRAVLANLLVRANQVVPAEVLIDEVWGDEPPGQARNTLQTYVSNLRRSLGDVALQHRAPGYVLVVDPRDLDAARFDALVRDARAALPVDPQVAIDTLEDALAMWRGPALADVADRSLLAEAARLDELRLEAQEERIGALLAVGATARAIAELEPLLAQHPLRERLWEQLMLAQYRDGRQAEALAGFQRAREILADELGIDPSPELVRLQGQILAHDPTLELRGEPLRGYRLLEKLGDSRDGVRFRAIQPRIGRDVTVEVVREDVAAGETFVARFEPEAQAVAALEHPHILPVYDYWREPGRAYIVTRFVRGPSLASTLDRGEAIDRERGLAIVDQLASALAFAHRQGVAHGDIGSGNVVFDADGNAYLGGFEIGAGPPPSAADDVRRLASLVPAILRNDVPPALMAAIDEASVADPGSAEAIVDALRASRAAHGITPRTAPDDHARNPYRGLRAFTEADSLDFFGRKAAVTRIGERLREPGRGSRFLAVVGPSGCGKSSLVRAGVVPTIRGGGLGGRGVFVAELTPGPHPMDELESALGRIAVRGVRRLGDLIRGGSRGLVEAVDRAIPGEADVVLVVDQLEELFTLTTDETERSDFLDSIRVASVDPDSRVTVIATLRADFFDQPLVYPRFGELLANRTEPVSPMQPDELEQAILGPAERAGVRLASGLEAEIIGDAAHEPGALPLVQFALTELFERRDESEMTLDAYRELGGIVGAVSTSADDIARRATAEERRAIRHVFLRLVTLGEGRSDTRRRVTRRSLDVLDIEPGAVDGVLETFGRHRILTFDREPSTREPTVEIAHEALLDAWPRLRGWIDEAREDLRRDRLLGRATAEWTGAQRDSSFLLRGARLEQTEEWVSTAGIALDADERAYVAASVAARAEERAAEERRRAHEEHVERRSARRLRALVAVFAVAALVAGSLTIVATSQSDRAEREAAIAAVRELAAASVASLETDPERSILLAIEAVDRSRAATGSVLPEAEEALHRSVAGSRLLATYPGFGDSVAVSRDGWMGAEVIDHPGQVAVLDGSGESRRSIDAHAGEVADLGITPDGRVLLTIGEDGWLRAWDVSTGQRLWQRHEPHRVQDPEAAHVLSVDGRGLLVAASWPEARRILVLDIPTGAVKERYRCSPDSCQASLSADGKRIAVAAGYQDPGIEGGWIGPVTGRGSRVSFLAPPWVGINGRLAWSVDGRHVSGSSFVWSSVTGKLLHPVEHGSLVGPTSWSPDGRLATGAGTTAKIWEVGPRELRDTVTLSTEASSSPVMDLAFTNGGERLVTASDAIRVWDVRPIGASERGSLDLSTVYVGGLAFTPQGDVVIAADQGRKRAGLVLWRPNEQVPEGLGGSTERGLGAPFSVNPVDGSVVRVVSVAESDPTRLVTSSGRALPFPADHFAWAPDGVHLVTSLHNEVALVDLEGHALWQIRQPFPIGVLTVAPDGRIAVAAGDQAADPRVIVLDGGTGLPMATLSVPDARGIALDPRGREVVVQTNIAGPLQVWDLTTGTQIGVYPDATSGELPFAFSPDGSTLATSGEDQVVRFYNTDTRQLRLTLPAPDDLLGSAPERADGDPRCSAQSVAFNTDGSVLASQGCAGVRVWDLDVDRLLAIARSRVTRSFTVDECRLYFRTDPCPAI